MVKCCYKNILESSGVTLYNTIADLEYPLSRLYDRNVGRMFKTSNTLSFAVLVDQGGSPVAIDRLIIPAGHTLNGRTVRVYWSTDGVSYTQAATGTPTTALYTLTWSSLTKRYWQIEVLSPGAITSIPEVFLSPTYEWERNPARPTGPLDDQFNVENLVTAGGQDRFLIHGSAKRQRVYPMPRCGEAQKTNILALNAMWAGSKPFWLCDHDGTWIFGKLSNPIRLKEEAYGKYSFEFEFLEVLP